MLVAGATLDLLFLGEQALERLVATARQRRRRNSSLGRLGRHSRFAVARSRGDVAAGSMGEPYLTGSKADVRIFAKYYDSIAPRFMYTGWMATIDYARTNRATVDKFRAALQESARYVNDHLSETADVMAKFTGIPAAVFAAMPRVKSALSVDPKLIQPLIDAAAKYKAIPASFDARDLIDSALH